MQANIAGDTIINKNQRKNSLDSYQKMLDDYVKWGFTYKSNEILHKLASDRYPYDLLLNVAKIYHLNQFEIIFFTHILSDNTKSCYDDPQIFKPQNHQFPKEVEDLIKEIQRQSFNKQEQNHNQVAEQILNNGLNEHHENDSQETPTGYKLKKIYLFLLVIGYAIKYYLNDQSKSKSYEQYLKKVFNKWAHRYGNEVLSTTPRKINSYYMSLKFMEGQEENSEEKHGDDCQYRNYNEIVEELIKATTEVEEFNTQSNYENHQD